jgi:glyoxylase-like metal-dependent hydrolase (beta-lactamase superfamily II)
MSRASSFAIAAILALVGCGKKEAAPEGGAPAAEAAPAAAAEAPLLRLYAMECGRIDVLDLGVFDLGGAYAGQTKSLIDTCYLVRHPAGDLLWDAGLPDSINAAPDGVTEGAFRITAPKTLVGQLADIGLQPADVEFFSASHSHFDHVGNANLFAAATFIVQKAERAFMFRDEARANAQEFASYSALENAPAREIGGDHDVFGDGRVKIVSMPGHTPGHSALLVTLANAGPVLLTGDLYHFTEAREKRTVPTWNTDPEETRRSMEKFEALAAKTGARVVIQHEPADYDALPKAPEYLD